MSEAKEGWVCPVCKTVKAPTEKICKPCSKDLKETTSSTQQLLTE